MYGYNPLCTAKKINLNEVIYYLWQVFCAQHCLSKRVLIDFPYLPCQPVDCHCSLRWRNSLQCQGVLPARALCCRAQSLLVFQGAELLPSPTLNCVYQKRQFHGYSKLLKIEVKHVIHSHFENASRIFLLESNRQQVPAEQHRTTYSCRTVPEQVWSVIDEKY